MKKAKYGILTALLSAGAAVCAHAQFMPCLIDTNPAPLLIADRAFARQFPGSPTIMVPDPNRVPKWELREAFIEPAVKVNPLGQIRWEFFMPVAGLCGGAFDSYVDSNAAADITREVIGSYTGIPMSKPTGDVEVIVFTMVEYNAWTNGRATTTRGGSTGKQTGGRFSVRLQPGWHVVVISNAHSGFYAKTVSFVFGGKPPGRTAQSPTTPPNNGPDTNPNKPFTAVCRDGKKWAVTAHTAAAACMKNGGLVNFYQN